MRDIHSKRESEGGKIVQKDGGKKMLRLRKRKKIQNYVPRVSDRGDKSKNKRQDQSEKRQIRVRWGLVLQPSKGRHSSRLA